MGNLLWGSLLEICEVISLPSLDNFSLAVAVAVSTLHWHRWKDLDCWFHWFHCHLYRVGRRALIVQGESWLMEILTDWGTQGRGLLEEKDPKESVSTY